MTKGDLVVRGLIAAGYREQKSSSSKYRRFTKAGERPKWVGKGGALRSGEVVTKAVSLTNTELHKQLIRAGEGVSVKRGFSEGDRVRSVLNKR